MTYKLVIFDLDGTLVRPERSGNFRQAGEAYVWLPGRLAKIKALHSEGVTLAIATNQGGVAFGYFTAEDFMTALDVVCREAEIIHARYCFTHPKATVEEWRNESRYRKPGPMMLLDILASTNCSREDTLMVGDRDDDKGAAAAAGVSFRWAEEFFG